MKKSEIVTGATYTAGGNHEYFVEGIRHAPGGRVVDYQILAGEGRGKRLTSPIDEFASRVTSRMADREPENAKGGI